LPPSSPNASAVQAITFDLTSRDRRRGVELCIPNPRAIQAVAPIEQNQHYSYYEEQKVVLRQTVAAVSDDPKGQTERSRGQPKKEPKPQSGIMYGNFPAPDIPDPIYADLWFCTFQVQGIWPGPRPTLRYRDR
jgi:hypothetical protein